VSRRIGVAVIGGGWMGDLHAAAYRGLHDYFPEVHLRPELVVAVDSVDSRASALAERHGFLRTGDDWREAIADPSVDVISVTAPNFVHREMGLAAVRAGKHLWIEKPLGRFPEEALEVADAAAEAGVVTMVGYNYRHAPAVQRAEEMVRTGRLGRITHFRASFLADYASHPQGALSWRFQRDLAGLGALGDLMSHVVNMSQALVGPIERVAAQLSTFIESRPIQQAGEGTHFSIIESGEQGTVENEDHVGAVVRFENGASGLLEVCRVSVGPRVRMGFEVNGTEGAVAWNFERMNELEVLLGEGLNQGYATTFAGPGDGEFARFQPGTGIPIGYAELKQIEGGRFLRAIESGRSEGPDIADAAATARVLRAMADAAERAAWVEVPR
jgi:predicted dehydrogenase